MSKSTKSKKLDVARNMPPLYHKSPNQIYNPMKSEVVEWLLKRPSIRDWVWDHFKQSSYVVYDNDTGKWQGVDFEED